MKEIRVKIAIIGAGTAGLTALREVKKKTDNFVLINGGEYGTTCARVGCMPSKALIQVAKDFHRKSNFDELGIRGSESLELDARAAFQRVRDLRNDFVTSVLRQIEKLGSKNIQGYAEFEDEHCLRVEDKKIYAEKIILAVGSRPVVPKEWAGLGDRLLSSDQIFELSELPAKLGVVGLGVVGLEMGQALSRLGSKVFGFDAIRSLGGISEAFVVNEALSQFSKEFDISLDAKVSPDRFKDFDRVLLSVGRQTNLDRMKIEKAGLSLEKGKIKYNPGTMQVDGSNHIFVAGDAEPDRPLLHEAAHEGRIAGLNSVAEDLNSFERKTPLHIVFSDPQLAVVGKLPDDRESCVVGDVSFLEQGRARILQENQGALRVYADKKSGKILAAAMCCPGGEHLAHFMVPVIKNKMTAAEAKDLPYYHPTLEEALSTAFGKILDQI